ncbi:MAG: hypothetical protein R3257_03655 [bacterium]|nr:hypothetical protein [bacterium]
MMRSLVLSVICILVLGLGATIHAAEKKEEAAPNPEAIVPVKDVSQQMAEVWCSKLAECAPNQEMGPKECRKVLNKSFKQGFKRTAEGQKVEVSAGKLSQCSESIKKDTCSALKSAQTLPGCDFISLLNRR